MAEIPKVFLSATSSDLAEHRKAATKAIMDARMFPVTMENFTAEDTPPLDLCLREVGRCDLLVAVVAHRYGALPKDLLPTNEKSYTWLECEHALSKRIPILPFVVDPKFDWPEEHKEEARIMEAFHKGGDVAAVVEDVRLAIKRLADFKAWLATGRTKAAFTTADSLQTAVGAALAKWQNARGGPKPPSIDQDAFQPYFAALWESTRYIDLQGLQVGSGKSHQFEIQDLYVTLTTLDHSDKSGKLDQPRKIKLEDALRHRRLLIEGDAGSGKTTFLRLMAHRLATQPVAGFPVWARVSDLDAHIEKSWAEPGSPAQRHAPEWIAHWLACGPWGLDRKAVERRLAGPGVALLIDGLDEAVDQTRRSSLMRMVQEAATRYPQCQIVVTTRPEAVRNLAPLAGFQLARIEELDDEAIAQFLKLWSKALYPDEEGLRAKLEADLREALGASAEIRRMASNPVMLTAMAVVYWNERRLPDARSDLYNSVLQWLIAAKHDSRTMPPERERLARHARLAWGMQAAQTTVIEPGKVAAALELDAEAAEAFVDSELVASGILVSRASKIQFWHKTFQEYLAARWLAGFVEDRLYKEVLRDQRLYKPEWREVMLLLAGVLLSRSEDHLNALFERIAADAPKGLAERARCVELLSAMVVDVRSAKFEPSSEGYKAMVREMRRLFEVDCPAGINLRTRAAAGDALGVSGHPRLYLPQDDRYWVDVGGGTYRMGAQRTDPKKPNHDDMAIREREPVRGVTVGAFQMGRYPVTVWEYGQFVEVGGKAPAGWDIQKSYPSRPVVRVSWHEAEAYCKWSGVRLPTEEEWEWAARGPDGRRYPWGDELPTPEIARANIRAWVGRQTAVGLLPKGRSWCGCDDMSGNVWEWTSSWYNENKDAKVLRGGGWLSDVSIARCAYRDFYAPAFHDFDCGFRCARTQT